MICEKAPAKINLTLEVVGKRGDGYHNIESVMQTVDLCDRLTFGDCDCIKVIPEYSSLPARDRLSAKDPAQDIFDNLVYKAADLLKQETGYKGGAAVQLEKSIPSSAGLGGGSSDAAATLKGLNKLWDLGLNTGDLSRLGAKIGSDVPFFIYGGTCLVRGRGEKVQKIASIAPKWVVVILFPIRISQKTAHLYGRLDPTYYTGGACTQKLVNSLGNGAGSRVDRYLFNVFEKVYGTSFAQFGQWTHALEQEGISPVHLAGSGPAVYYMAASGEEAKKDLDLLREMGFDSYIARTVP